MRTVYKQSAIGNTFQMVKKIDCFSSLEQMNTCFVSFDKGDPISQEGENADYLYLILEGQVRIYSFSEEGSQFTITYATAPDLLGDVEYSANLPIQNNVEATKKTLTMKIPIEQNRKILQQDLKFYQFLCQRMAKKIYGSSDDRKTTNFYSAKERLQAYLELRAESGIIACNLGEISHSLGITYRHLMRLMEQLCKEGIIERTGKKGQFRLL